MQLTAATNGTFSATSCAHRAMPAPTVEFENAVGQCGPMETAALREWVTDAIRYWEPRRIVYNLVLMGVVLACFVVALPLSKGIISLNFALVLFMMAVLANVAYCSAYVVDLFAQISGFRELWQKYRWLLFLVGMIFAGIITRFWSLAVFSPGQ
jgi:hypothetical protein